jgi:hypothetical protein
MGAMKLSLSHERLAWVVSVTRHRCGSHQEGVLAEAMEGWLGEVGGGVPGLKPAEGPGCAEGGRW